MFVSQKENETFQKDPHTSFYPLGNRDFFFVVKQPELEADQLSSVPSYVDWLL